MLSRRTFLGGALPADLWGQKLFADAEAYERFMGRWSRLVARRLVEFTGAPAGGRFLDIGSGTGALAFELARRQPGAVVQGVDPSEEYVAYARSKNAFAKRVSFDVGDAQALRYPDAAFDGCLSLLVFNFIPDAKKAIREARRVTRPRGRISAAVWDYGGGMQMLRVFWDAAVATDRAAAPLDEAKMPLCRAGELEALWKEGGLESVTGQALDIRMSFASFDDYWSPFLLGQGPAGAYAGKLDTARREVLRAEVKRRLGRRAENGSFSLQARVWAVRGSVPAL